MRCQKCGYISFDQMETCGGCKKNIAKAAQELSGVVFKSESPDFLWFKRNEEEEEAQEEEDAPEEKAEGVDFGLDEDRQDTANAGRGDAFAAAAEDGGGLDVSADQPQEIEFDLSTDSGAQEKAEPEVPKEEIAFELPEMQNTALEEAAPENAKQEKELSLEAASSRGGLEDLGLDFDLDDSASAPPPRSAPAKEDKQQKAGKPVAKEQAAAKSAKKGSPLDLDLAELDLDGVMPPAAEESKIDFSFSGLGELSLEETGKEGGSKPGKKAAGGKSKGADDVLPDLAMEGLNLDAPILPPTSKKLRPAAKTGTALDEFDIDLGELLGGGGKKN